MILITRPYEDSVLFSQALNARGIENITCSLMEISPVSLPTHHLKNPQALILTSPHAFYAIKALDLKPQFIFAVGLRLRQLWQQHGPKESTFIGHKKGVAHLLHSLKSHLNPEGGGVIYLQGSHVSYMFQSADVVFLPFETIVCYKARSCSVLSTQVLKALRQDEITGITFFSKRAIEVFCEVCGDCTSFFHKTVAYCISNNVADQAKKRGFQRVVTSLFPDTAHMIQRIQEVHDT